MCSARCSSVGTRGAEREVDDSCAQVKLLAALALRRSRFLKGFLASCNVAGGKGRRASGTSLVFLRPHTGEQSAARLSAGLSCRARSLGFCEQMLRGETGQNGVEGEGRGRGVVLVRESVRGAGVRRGPVGSSF